MVYGATATAVQMSNLISTAGVVSSDVSGVGTARQACGGCSFA